MSQLNFACLIRVSTERQQKRGESLETQRKQLEQSVKSLGATIFRWYAGQEHATPEEERGILNQLMRDAQDKLFDAVMVADVSRWSRDNRQSKRDLDILKKHGIRFFVQTKEYDLFSPDAALYLGLSTEIHEFFGLEQARKSLLNRIERAKKGYPSAGNQPFGRRFNRETEQWEVIEADKALMEKMADAYLNDGLTFAKLETKFGMKWSYIYKILRYRCGSDWEQTFVSKRLNIEETIITKIPALLPERVIKQIAEKASSRRKWDHATPKHKYLLNRIIFSADTGKPLTGSSRIDPNGTRCRYYSRYDKGFPSLYVRADEIEKSVQDVIYETLGQRRDLQRAVFENPEDGDNTLKTLTEKIDFAKKGLAKVEAEVSKIADVLIKSADVSVLRKTFDARLKKLQQRHDSLTFDLQQAENALKALPEPEQVDDIQALMEKNYFSAGLTFADLPFEEQRKVLILLFGGMDDSGKRFGIYISKFPDKKISFLAYGKLGTIRGKLLEIPPFDVTESKMKKKTIQEISKIVRNQQDTSVDEFSRSEDVVDHKNAAAPYSASVGNLEGAFHVLQALPAVEAGLRLGPVFSYNGVE
ncbi:MAG: recombinase family protein [Syntrophobacteraceae bacterium]